MNSQSSLFLPQQCVACTSAMLRVYASVVGTLGSRFLVWLKYPNLVNHLIKSISHYTQIPLTLPFSLVPLLGLETVLKIQYVSNAATSGLVASPTSIFEDFPSLVSLFNLPTIDWSTATLMGGILHLLMMYLFPGLHFSPCTHLFGKLVPVFFWSMVGWFLSTSWGLDDLSLAPLIHMEGAVGDNQPYYQCEVFSET